MIRDAAGGLDPVVVDYSRWPGLNAEKLEKGLNSDKEALESVGYSVNLCFVDHGQTAEKSVTDALAEISYDCILIGAGVRKDEHEFPLFEKLVNVVHQHAPDARICFNTGPTDSVDAVKRWT